MSIVQTIYSYLKERSIVFCDKRRVALWQHHNFLLYIFDFIFGFFQINDFNGYHLKFNFGINYMFAFNFVKWRIPKAFYERVIEFEQVSMRYIQKSFPCRTYIGIVWNRTCISVGRSNGIASSTNVRKCQSTLIQLNLVVIWFRNTPSESQCHGTCSKFNDVQLKFALHLLHLRVGF